MRDPNRIDEILEVAGRVWKLYPDFRLGQMLIVAAHYRGYSFNDIFNVEDDKLLEGLKRLERSLTGDMSDEIKRYDAHSQELKDFFG